MMASLPRRLGGSGIIRPFADGYFGYDPRLPFQRFDAFSTFSPSEDADPSFDRLPPASHGFAALATACADFGLQPEDVPAHHHPAFASGGDSIPPSPEDYGFSSEAAAFGMPQANGTSYGTENGEIFTSDGPVLPDPDEMHREEGFILREWRRRSSMQMRTNNTGKQLLNLSPMPSVVIQGSKSGKPTHLSRLRQILVKLKRNLPPDMKSSTPLVSVEAKDGASAAGKEPSSPANDAKANGPSASVKIETSVAEEQTTKAPELWWPQPNLRINYLIISCDLRDSFE